MNAITQTGSAVQSTVASDAPVFDTAAVAAAAQALCNTDKAFEKGIEACATSVAQLLGTEPSFSLWNDVQCEFVLRYTEARACKEETSAQRWRAIASEMEAQFALEKPAKPTKAAEVKAKQRSDAQTQAVEMIERAKASTPAAVLALSSGKEPIPAPVIAALAKEAGRMAADSAKAANDAAKTEMKTLREALRKAVGTLTLEQLRKVSKMVDGFAPVEVEAEQEVAAD